MESEEKIESFKKADKENNRIKNMLCKNAICTFEVDKEDYAKRLFTYKYKNSGCKNLRRNGSAYCQECSDKFKQN